MLSLGALLVAVSPGPVAQAMCYAGSASKHPNTYIHYLNVQILEFCLLIRVLVYIMLNIVLFKSAACIDLACYLVLYFLFPMSGVCPAAHSGLRRFLKEPFSVPPDNVRWQAVPTFTLEIIIRYNN